VPRSSPMTAPQVQLERLAARSDAERARSAAEREGLAAELRWAQWAPRNTQSACLARRGPETQCLPSPHT
jgi:hypothetical protein